MRYVIEDTPAGYRLTLTQSDGTVLASINEDGGHGPLERLYARADGTWHEGRDNAVRAATPARPGSDAAKLLGNVRQLHGASHARHCTCPMSVRTSMLNLGLTAEQHHNVHSVGCPMYVAGKD